MKTLEKYEKLRKMCREQTRLSEEDIDFLEIMAVAIEQMAKMEEADIYIDCLAKNGLPLVVAEAKSSWAVESGQPLWLGHYMEPYNEPAAYQALTAGVRSRGVNSMTENGLQFLQTAEPLQRQGRVIGVLLKEQRILGGEAEAESDKDPADMEVLLSGIDRGGVSEYIDEGVLLIDAQGKVASANKAAQRIYEKLGYAPEKLLGERLEKVCLVNLSGEQKNQIEDSYVIETKVGGLDLIIHYFYLGDGRMMILLKDQTRERKRESELVVKSVMINEIHHRIKNNLQMVVSFLNLQKRRSQNEEVRQSLETAAARVMSIASTHGMFALKKNDRVSLGELLEVLENNFQESVRLQERQIELHVTGDKLIIDFGDGRLPGDHFE